MQQVKIREMKRERETKILEKIFCGDTAAAFPCLKVCNGDISLFFVCPLIRDLGLWGGTFCLGIFVGVGSSHLHTCCVTAMVQGAGS